jgi:hypothetical protein
MIETRIIDYAALRASYRGAMRWQRIQLRIKRWKARATSRFEKRACAITPCRVCSITNLDSQRG